MIDGVETYEYRFRMKINEGANNVPSLFYSFQSPRTEKVYHVLVDIFPNSFYVVKFFLKDHKKYEVLRFCIDSCLHEARPVFLTCIKIMIREVRDKCPEASFGFIGSPTKAVRVVDAKTRKETIKSVSPEANEETRRFRIYSRLMATYIQPEEFEHHVLEKESAYLLFRKTEIAKQPTLKVDIMRDMSERFDIEE